MERDAREDAPRARAQPRERDAEGGENRERVHEAVREPEEHADAHDRCYAAEAGEDGEARAAEEQFLADRKQHRREHEVGGERRRTVRIPAVGHEALLVARMKDRLQQAGEDHDPDEDHHRELRRPAPARRPPQREQLRDRPVPRDADHEGDRQRELDEAGRERLPAIERVAGGRAGGTAVVLEGDEQQDVSEPDGEPGVAACSRRDVVHTSSRSARSSGAGAKWTPAALAPSRSSSPSPTWRTRSGVTARASRATVKIRGSGLATPASAAETTADTYGVRPARSSCS